MHNGPDRMHVVAVGGGRRIDCPGRDGRPAFPLARGVLGGRTWRYQVPRNLDRRVSRVDDRHGNDIRTRRNRRSSTTSGSRHGTASWSYVAQPHGVAPTAFTLLASSPPEAPVFANPAHDFPEARRLPPGERVERARLHRRWGRERDPRGVSDEARRRVPGRAERFARVEDVEGHIRRAAALRDEVLDIQVSRAAIPGRSPAFRNA